PLISLVRPLVSLPPTQAGAQPLVFCGDLSKRQAIARAMTAAFDVRSAQANAAAASARASGARGMLLPQLTVTGADTSANLPQFGMPVARQSYITASASVPILNLASNAGQHLPTLDAIATAGHALSAKNDAALAAYRAYDQAAFAAAVGQARQAAVADQQANANLVALRVRVGKAARYQLYRAQASLAQARQAAEDAGAGRDEGVNNLNA